MPKIEDPTFDTDGTKWITAAALNSETDGYFMIPSDQMSAAWTLLDADQAKAIWGKGYALLPQQFKTPNCPKSPCTTGCSCPVNGMPKASAFSMNATLNIVDTPLSYSPPIGPDMGVVVNYNYNEAEQPSNFTFTNLGHNWSLNWLSYLTIDSTDPIHRIVKVRVRGGGYEQYTEPFGNRNPYSLAIIAEVNNAGVISWERRMPDGSVEKYERKNAAGDTFFLTQVVDPQNNAAVLSYSSNTVTDPGYFRLASITDACGNSPMTVTYDSNSSTDPGYYKVTSVADGFGRSASFAYSSDKSQLLSITDAVGNQSKFSYQTDTDSTFINLMVTPYGSTGFYRYTPAGATGAVPEGMTFTLPDGSSTRIENWLGELKYTYFWDREASEMYPDDAFNNVYTHCQTTRWLYTPNSVQTSIPSWTRKPLEAPVSYYFPGQTGWNQISGGFVRVQQMSQQLVPIKNTITIGGTITAGNIIKVELDDLGLPEGLTQVSYTVVAGDTTSTIAAGLVQSINNSTPLQAFGITATSVGNVVTVSSLTPNDFDSSKFVNKSGAVTETLTFTTGTNRVQNFTCSGTATAGQVYAITVTDSTLPGGSQTISYTVQTGDSNADIAQALSLGVNANANLQASKISSAWSSAFYIGVGQTPSSTANPVIGVQTNSTSSTTYSGTVNGAASANFSSATSAHGLVKANYNLYTDVGNPNPTAIIDQLGRRLDITYAANDIDVIKVLENAALHSSLVGYWTYGTVPHKPTAAYDSSLQHTLYTYQSNGELATVTDRNGATTTYNYNANSYLSSIDGPLSGNQDVTTFSFYGYGLPSSITDSEGYTLNFSYDGLNRLTSTAFPDGTTEDTRYNRLDAVMMSDRIGRWTQRTYDSMQNLVSEVDPLGRQTKYCWCHCGGLASLTDPAGNTTKWHHDLEGRVIQKEYADGSHYDYVYETTNSRIASISDAIQPTPQSTIFTYNLNDSVAVKRYANAVNATSQVVSAFDPYFDRPQSISNGWGQYNYKYYPYYKDAFFNPDNGWTSIVVGGIPEVPNATDTISIVFYSSNLAGGQYTFNYTVPAGDVGNTNQLATHLSAAIDADTTLNNAGINPSLSSNFVIRIHNQTVDLRVAPTATGGTIVTCGSGKLSDVTNTVISNSQISYGYDGEGRTQARLINGGNNQSRWTFDAMGRVTTELNPLGTFNYAYIDNTAGSSKGVNRLASITYPNSQVTNFSWLPNIGDQRLQQISNLSPSATTLSKFAYAYNSAGEITQWQQLQNSVNTHLGLAYDNAGQLITAVSDSGTLFKAYIAGTPHAGDVVSVTAYDASLTGTTPVGQETASYTVVGGDTSATIATNLASAITSVMGTNLGLSASASGKVISITTSATRATQFTSAVSGVGATDTIIMDRGQPSGNRHSQLYYAYDCAGNRTGVQGDSTGSFGAGGLNTNATAYGYNNLNELTNYAPGGPIRFEGSTTNPIISAVANVTKTVTVTGSVTAGDKLTVSVHDPAITAGKDITYTVVGGNTTTDIATGLKNLINADSTLSSLGITATSSANVLTITSTSANKTMYSASKNTGASETLTLNASASDTALISPSTAFSSNPKLALSSNTVKVTAKSGGGTAATNSYPISINSASSATLQYDANGNMTSDGTNTYSWDAENRLIQITYPGSGNNTQFSYDALSRATKIEERTAGSVTSTKQHHWAGLQKREERDGAGTLTNGKLFFAAGEISFVSGAASNCFFTQDHLGSTREFTSSIGGTFSVQAVYAYSPYGNAVKVAGSNDTNFQFAAMYTNLRSGVVLTLKREFSPTLGRWLSRDPLGEIVSNNLFDYADNNPVLFVDVLGLAPITGPTVIGPACPIKGRDPCADLLASMASRISQINHEVELMYSDPGDLFHLAYATPNPAKTGHRYTYFGHAMEIENYQTSLGKSYKKAVEMGCLGIPTSEVKRALNAEIPMMPAGETELHLSGNELKAVMRMLSGGKK